MSRKRTESRKIGSSNGKSFELTSFGNLEKDKAVIKANKQREHKMIKKINQARIERIKKNKAIAVLDEILNSRICQPSEPQNQIV